MVHPGSTPDIERQIGVLDKQTDVGLVEVVSFVSEHDARRLKKFKRAECVLILARAENFAPFFDRRLLAKVSRVSCDSSLIQCEP